MEFLYAVLLIVVLLSGCVLTLLAMPGNWLIVTAVAVYAWLVPGEGRLAIGWEVVGVLVLLAIVGEVLEFLASALGAAKAGGSKRGAVLAMVGSMVGALVGLFVGIPIPVVGPIIAAVLFAGLGAFGGALLGEIWKGRKLDKSWQVGKAAFCGRVLGSVAKTAVGAMMAGVTIAAMVL